MMIHFRLKSKQIIIVSVDFFYPVSVLRCLFYLGAWIIESGVFVLIFYSLWWGEPRKIHDTSYAFKFDFFFLQVPCDYSPLILTTRLAPLSSWNNVFVRIKRRKWGCWAARAGEEKPLWSAKDVSSGACQWEFRGRLSPPPPPTLLSSPACKCLRF